MKALTICQPYAHLICISKEKAVENRTWSTNYRGPLLIHAGKSREWLYDDESGKEIDFEESTGELFTFGAIIGAATLADCLHIDKIESGDFDAKFPWLREHAHTSGPWCWVLRNRCAFQTPIRYRGAQGLFDVPDEVVAEQIALLRTQRKAA